MSARDSRVAIVTGGTGGLGTAITARLRDDGFRVAVADIAAEKVAVVREQGTLVLPPDLAPEALPVAREMVTERHARIVTAERDLGLPMLIVAANRLGTINHCALTARAAAAAICRCASPARCRSDRRRCL